MEKLQRSKGLDVTLSLIKTNCVYKKKKKKKICIMCTVLQKHNVMENKRYIMLCDLLINAVKHTNQSGNTAFHVSSFSKWLKGFLKAQTHHNTFIIIDKDARVLTESFLLMRHPFKAQNWAELELEVHTLNTLLSHSQLFFFYV